MKSSRSFISGPLIRDVRAPSTTNLPSMPDAMRCSLRRPAVQISRQSRCNLLASSDLTRPLQHDLPDRLGGSLERVLRESPPTHGASAIWITSSSGICTSCTDGDRATYRHSIRCTHGPGSRTSSWAFSACSLPAYRVCYQRMFRQIDAPGCSKRACRICGIQLVHQADQKQSRPSLDVPA